MKTGVYFTRKKNLFFGSTPPNCRVDDVTGSALYALSNWTVLFNLTLGKQRQAEIILNELKNMWNNETSVDTRVYVLSCWLTFMMFWLWLLLLLLLLLLLFSFQLVISVSTCWDAEFFFGETSKSNWNSWLYNRGQRFVLERDNQPKVNWICNKKSTLETRNDLNRCIPWMSELRFFLHVFQFKQKWTTQLSCKATTRWKSSGFQSPNPIKWWNTVSHPLIQSAWERNVSLWLGLLDDTLL